MRNFRREVLEDYSTAEKEQEAGLFPVALAFDISGIRIKLTGLAEQIEAHIGERHVLFQGGRMAAPFRQPMSQNQRVVGAAQRVQHQRGFGDLN